MGEEVFPTVISNITICYWRIIPIVSTHLTIFQHRSTQKIPWRLSSKGFYDETLKEALLYKKLYLTVNTYINSPKSDRERRGPFHSLPRLDSDLVPHQQRYYIQSHLQCKLALAPVAE